MMRIMVSMLASLLVVGLAAPAFAQGGTDAGKGAKRQKERKLTKKPKLVKEVKATYTDEALEQEVEGVVKLQIRIGKTGKVEKVKVLDGLGHGLDASAKKAAKQFEFEPAEINDKPAAVVLPFKIRFTLPVRPATFRGTVVSKKNDDPVEDVKVSIVYRGEEYEKTPRATTATDGKGAFSFENVPPGPYTVRISASRYQKLETKVELSSGDSIEAKYRVDLKPIRLAGTIVEAGTRDPLPGIKVSVNKPDDATVFRETFTGEGGTFALRGLPPGRYDIHVTADGYKSVTHQEAIPEDGGIEVKYFLKADYYGEYSVRTTAKREQEAIDKKTIQLEELRRIPGTGGDVVRAVKNLPGVARAPFSGGQLIVRGSTPQSTRTFIEGDEIPLIYHFFGGPAVINSEMIDAVEFFPGNYRARYGRALAGIVNLQTRRPKSDRVHGFTEVDVLDATAQIEGPINDDVSFAVSGRRSYIDFVLPAVLPDDGLGLRVAPNYYDYQGWLSWDVSSEHNLQLFLYGSNDTLEALFDESDPPGNSQVQLTGLDVDNGFHRGQLQWEWRPNDSAVENDAMVSFGGNRVGFEAAENLYFRLNFLQLQIRDDFRWEISEAIEFALGTDTQIGRSKYSAEIPAVDNPGGGDPGASRDSQQPDYAGSGLLAEGRTGWLVQPAVYSEFEIEPLDGLEIVPGMRVDYFGDIEQFAYSPRLTSRWQISDLVQVKGGAGLFTQPPNPGQTAEDFGNPNLTFEKGLQYSAGAVLTPVDFLEFDTTLFYRDLYDLVTTTEQVRIDPDSGEPTPVVYNNSLEGRAYGAEVLIRHHPANKFFGWLAYSLSRSERRDPVSGEWQVFQYDQTHNLTAVAGYNLPWNVDISARFRLVTGNPTTPVVGSVWNADSDSYVPIYGEANSVRQGLFHQLDLRVDKTFVFNTWRMGIYLDIINAYNAKNPEGKRYNYDYSKSATVNGLPILPTLGLNARF